MFAQAVVWVLVALHPPVHPSPYQQFTFSSVGDCQHAINALALPKQEGWTCRQITLAQPPYPATTYPSATQRRGQRNANYDEAKLRAIIEGQP